mgnify:CR=1 FL=1
MRTYSVFGIFSVFGMLATAAEVPVFNISCDSHAQPTHIIRMEITLDAKAKTCSAISVDTGGRVGSHFTYVTRWKCKVQPLQRTKESQDVLVEFSVDSSKGIGSEEDRYNLYWTLRQATGEASGPLSSDYPPQFSAPKTVPILRCRSCSAT